MKKAASAGCCLAICLLAGGPTRSETPVDFGSVCLLPVADPTPGEKSLYNYTAGNPEPDYSVRFGEGALVRVPHSPKGKGPGVLITEMPLDRTYLAQVYLKGKRIESFRFRFETDHQGQLCLFMVEFYLTWQLWPSSQMPACRCKGATPTPWRQS